MSYEIVRNCSVLQDKKQVDIMPKLKKLLTMYGLTIMKNGHTV